MKKQLQKSENLNNLLIKLVQKKKEYIENKINSDSWVKKFIDNQLNGNENYYTFGENFQ